MREKEARDIRVEAQPVAGGTNNVDSGKEAVTDLEHILNRLKVWLELGNTNPDVANYLLDRERVEEAAELLSLKSGADDKRTEALKALGLYEEAEKNSGSKSLFEILDSNTNSSAKRKEEISKVWMVKHATGEKSIEEWIREIKSKSKLKPEDETLLKELKSRIELIKDRYGIEGLKYVKLDNEKLSEIEDGISSLSAKKEFYLSQSYKKNSDGETPVSKHYLGEIKDQAGLLQVRDAKSGDPQLADTVKRVRGDAEVLNSFEELDKLTEVQLLARFRDVNNLLWNIKALRGSELGYVETRRLKLVLINLQTQYQEQLANKFAEEWKNQNKLNSWQEVKYQSVEKALNKRRWWFSAKVDFDGANDDASNIKNLAKLKKDVNVEANLAAKKIENAKYKIQGSQSVDERGEPSDTEWMNQKKWKAVDTQLEAILAGSTYNPFEDENFWSNLQLGDQGIDKIVAQAKKMGLRSSNEMAFRDLIEDLRTSKETASMGGGRPRYGMGEGIGTDEGTPAVLSELMMFMNMGEYGAAANAMLEYTTRVGMQENTNDLQYMYVRRMFLEKISKISPDFAEQFGKNQQMGYLPSLFAQKPEEFYGVQGKVFNKSNLDLFFGPNAFMSGNVIKLPDGREFVYSTKTFMAALRSERNILRIMRADPNTMDSTLQNIMLEEMFGEGAHITPKKIDGKDVLFLSVEGKRDVALSDIKVDVSFANVDKTGFTGWRDPIKFHGKKNRVITDEAGRPLQFSLEEMMNRNQWILRNGVNFMWYSETWMDTLKSYQPSIMGNAPKALLTAASAIADYKASFENVAPPFLDLVQKLGDMLGPMERYKSADMIARNVADRLTDEMMKGGWLSSEEDRKNKRKEYEAVGELIERIFVRKTKAPMNGTEVTLKNRTRSREMTRFAFNDFTETSDDVAKIVRKRLLDLGMYKADIPDLATLKSNYAAWKNEQSKGVLLSGKEGYMGQEYAAVWEELSELKMSSSDREIWNNLGKKEFKILNSINAEVTGGFNGSPDKKAFWDSFEIEAFMDRTGTKHGDDWEQFAMKYSGAKIEALKLIYKIASLNGTAEDYDKLKQQLDLFMPPEEKRTILLSLMDRQSIATREEWLVPYEVADIASDHSKGSYEIKWLEYTDSTGKKFFARTADGTRAYHKKQFRGNYARQVLDKDWWRPRDFELLLDKWRGDGLLTKHEAHHMAEKLLGTRRSVNYFVDGFAKSMGTDPKNLEWLKNGLTKSTTAVKLLALKLFLFDDPKYAAWTLFEEFWGFGGKTFEHIFGVAVGGGSKH